MSNNVHQLSDKLNQLASNAESAPYVPESTKDAFAEVSASFSEITTIMSVLDTPEMVRKITSSDIGLFQLEIQKLLSHISTQLNKIETSLESLA